MSVGGEGTLEVNKELGRDGVTKDLHEKTCELDVAKEEEAMGPFRDQERRSERQGT